MNHVIIPVIISHRVDKAGPPRKVVFKSEPIFVVYVEHHSIKEEKKRVEFFRKWMKNPKGKLFEGIPVVFRGWYFQLFSDISNILIHPANILFLTTRVKHVTVAGLAASITLNDAINCLYSHSKINLEMVLFAYIRYEGDRAELIFSIEGGFQGQYIQKELFSKFLSDNKLHPWASPMIEFTLPKRKSIEWYAEEVQVLDRTLNTYAKVTIAGAAKVIKPVTDVNKMKSPGPKVKVNSDIKAVATTTESKVYYMSKEDADRSLKESWAAEKSSLLAEMDKRQREYELKQVEYQAMIHQQNVSLTTKTSDNSVEISQIGSFVQKLLKERDDDRKRVEEVAFFMSNLNEKVDEMKLAVDDDKLGRVEESRQRNEELRTMRSEQKEANSDMMRMLSLLTSNLIPTVSLLEKVINTSDDEDTVDQANDMDWDRSSTIVTRNRFKKLQESQPEGIPAAKKNIAN
jgi:hypothetical protein